MKTMQTRNKPTWPLAEHESLYAYLQHILTLKPRGLCTDIDGTISLIAPTVDAAVLLPGMHKLLTLATKQFDLVATISGRAVANQRTMINVPNVWHVGHHGYEWEESAEKIPYPIVLYPGVEPYLAEISTAMDEIEIMLTPKIPGLWMERKGITGGIHWRLAEDHEQAEQIAAPIIKRIAAEHGVRVRGGKFAMELYPPITTHKGEGLRRLVEKHQLQSIIYLGDEPSDTDAFQEIQHMRAAQICEGIAIAVTNEGSTSAIAEHADMVVSGPREVKKFLESLLILP